MNSLLKNRRWPDWAGGESLATPRGVSNASRRCKQRPSKFFVGERFFSEIYRTSVTYPRLKYSAENMSSEYRSEKSLASFAFLACRPTYSALLSQHPHLLSAIDLQDGVHTPRERAIQLQSASNTSSSSLVIGSHKGHEGHEGFKNLDRFGIATVQATQYTLRDLLRPL